MVDRHCRRCQPSLRDRQSKTHYPLSIAEGDALSPEVAGRKVRDDPQREHYDGS